MHKRVIGAFISLLCFSSISQAAIVTFEELPLTIDPCGPMDQDQLPCLQSIATPQGFVFSDAPGDPYLQTIAVTDGNIVSLGEVHEPDGQYLRASAAYDAPLNVEITHQSGRAFSLASMDVFFYDIYKEYEITPSGPVFQSTTPIEFMGFNDLGQQIAQYSLEPSDIDGTSISSWTNVGFGDEWSNVHKVTVSEQVLCSNWGCSNRYALIDNFTATVVPIPAAVWLFGSALAGLGWLKRKHVA
jgi:hypothetical protein